MRTFWWVSGQLTEVQRFINVPMRWCEQYPARERRELWVTTAQDEEFKLVVHTRVMPARRGHQVVAVLLGGQLVGLRNLTTGERVNFVRSDPPLLWRRCEGVVAVAAVVGGIAVFAMAGGLAPLLVALAAIVSTPSVVIARWVKRSRTRREVDRAMDEAKRQATRQPALRRVK